MGEIVIRAENLSKQYKIGPRQPYETLRDQLAQGARRFFSREAKSAELNYIWALKDVSFEVAKGEVMGLVGRNGSGKSTLLKVLSRITEPTEGNAEISGRVGSLLEVGTGFHPELTGRENIYLSGAILGMKKSEIFRKFDAITAFAEVEKHIDTPVKHFSSGMYMRLAFAVAAHLETEILIIDEVLSVGDTAFQKKCLGKIEDVGKQGRTIIFVTHNMAALENLCTRAILLDNGRLVMQDDTRKVVNYYLERVMVDTVDRIPLLERKDRHGNGLIRFSSFHIEDTEGRKLSAARSGMDIVFVFGFHCKDSSQTKNIDVGFSLHDMDNTAISVHYSSYLGQLFSNVPENGFFRFSLKKLALSQGSYWVGARILVNGVESDWPLNGVGSLFVETGDFYATGNRGFEGKAPVLLDGRWDVLGPHLL